MRIRKIIIFLTCAVWAARAEGASLPLGAAALSNPNGLITPAIANALTKSIGLSTDHRSYEGPTALGSSLGLDVGFEVTIAKVPPDFTEALKSLGLGSTTTPFLPIFRIHVHKGIGSKLGLNFTYLEWEDFLLMSAEAKLTLSTPEEGPTTAARISYSEATVLYVSTTTVTPQFLIGRRLDFAEPYIGVGYQMATGLVSVPIKIRGKTLYIEGKGKGRAPMAFTGVQFNTPGLGFQLTLEGSYSPAGASGVGTKIGFAL